MPQQKEDTGTHMSECETSMLQGSKWWHLDGKLHREDGPAIEYSNGTKTWYLHGLLHREDGPAYEGADGSKRWYLDGKEVTEAHLICLNRQRKLELI